MEMSLSSIVSKLYRGAVALVASAAIYVSGCASDVKQSQSQPSVSQTQFSVLQHSESPVVRESTKPIEGSVSDSDVVSGRYFASVCAVMKFGDDDLSGRKVSSYISLSSLDYYNRLNDLNADGVDGVFDDTFDSSEVFFGSNRLSKQFDFYAVDSRSDSELRIISNCSIRFEEFEFDSVLSRDAFVSGLSGVSAGFRYLIDEATRHSGADKILDGREVEALVETAKIAVKFGRASAGRGFVCVKDKETFEPFKTRIWNAYVSAEYTIDGRAEDLDVLKQIFVIAGAVNSDCTYDSYSLFAHQLDVKDGSVDGVISAESIWACDERGDLALVNSELYEHLSKDVRFASWPSYSAVVRFMFTSKDQRDVFMDFAGKLEPGLVISKGVHFAELDGVLYGESGKRLNSRLEELAYYGEYAELEEE